jgi:sulfatase modifying factor 1
VLLSCGFLLGEAPLAQAESAAVVGATLPVSVPRSGPVERVSWFDAVSFCNALASRVGLEAAYVVNGKHVTWKGLSCPGFRLPTEAEWESACRAGTTGTRYGNLDAVAWHQGNSGRSTHPVRGKQPNTWGLHDTLGNVWEWCWDCYGDYPRAVVTDPQGPGSSSSRVGRGGSWCGGARYGRAAYRSYFDPYYRFDLIGFRLAKSLP